MKFLDLLRMSSSSLWKRKVRTLLTILGVVVGTASIVVMISLGLGLNRATMQEIEKYGGLTTIDVYEKGSMYTEADYNEDSSKDQTVTHLDDDVVAQLEQIEHVTSAYPVITVDALLFSGSYQTYVSVQGLKEEALRNLNLEYAEGGVFDEDSASLQMVFGNTVKASLYNENTQQGYWYNGEVADVDLMRDAVFVIFDTDAYYEFKWGSTDEEGKPVNRPKKHLVEAAGLMAGSFDEYNSNSEKVFCDLEMLKKILQKEFKGKVIPGQPTTASGKAYKKLYYTSIVVNVDDMNNMKEVQKNINEMGFSANSNSEWIESEQKQLNYIQMVLGGIGAVSLLVAAIGITNTMMMSIYERTKEIGIMKVLGCGLKNIQAMFLLEAAYIGFIGGMAGLLLSCGVSAVINFFLGSGAMGMEMGVEASGLSYIPPWLAGLSVLFATLVGMLAGFFPSLRAMKLSPLAAIRNE
ncbi:MAG: ABC transporter permease [Lachnospiraceae bacterium]|jgi:ABC-type antimicrobial peptide transport system permease subunit|nr:ABC transporter permease [Lachnospiraceae bacterium]